MEDKAYAPVTETSSVESEMTGNDEFVEQEESSVMNSQEMESSKWTNEKHSLYLKSIEASFVDQLYNSLDMLSCQTQYTYCSDTVSSGQYKAFRHGCWSKKSFIRQNSHLKDADRPHVSPGKYWIQHFRNGSRKRLSSTTTSPQYPLDSQLDQWPSCSKSHAIVAEVTDQNFVEDTSCSRKRVRTSESGHSSNDQVVPHCTSAATEIPDSYAPPK